jgi:hypothetical protein
LFSGKQQEDFVNQKIYQHNLLEVFVGSRLSVSTHVVVSGMVCYYVCVCAFILCLKKRKAPDKF